MNTPEHENDAIQHVVDRLTEKFETVPAEVVAQAVHETHESFEGARVRDYVPVIVEHDARERLRQVDVSA